ncbi:MAG: NAD(P)(+) transhydrogenase (Re/Si-specific) subunit beta [Clostridiales bacterium]|nr:NAD(P)(+) transhydrogenase (Re/Si-specific) subunit beta [Clostridiales bacterium]
MNDILYYVLSSVLVLMVLAGIYLMSKVKLSSLGNRISALAMLGGIIVTLFYAKIITVPVLYIAMAIGLIAGLVFSSRVKMIQMPQMVALLNGLGGAASAIVGCFSLMGIGADINAFSLATSALAITVGMVTLTGSLVAAGKLHRILPQKPIVLKRHPIYTIGLLAAVLVLIVLSSIYSVSKDIMWVFVVTNLVASGAFGVIFSIRVGGADMPITISLLNSLSGVAGAIAGLAINNLLLVAVGGIVGASGLLLTQIMCRAINRSLLDILLGTNTKARRQPKKEAGEAAEAQAKEEPENQKPAERSPSEILSGAKNVIIVPGYGMAIAQAQHLVKKLADKLVENGARVKYAIHPVAGRMPGHMNVLLCEANVDYEDLYEMDDINGEFAAADATIVVGANDVLNPAAREAEGTPIYGMPILNVDKCKEIFIFNYDKKPGYAGVDNPIYSRKDGVHLYLGNAADTLQSVLVALDAAAPIPEAPAKEQKADPTEILRKAKNIIIVPGYGMAIAQAQHLVKKLADKLVENGAKVKYAIHPVAGRMPGHMNVLLCEANVDYEDLYEMAEINGEFASADAAIVVGANDVLNPAAREAEGTPIYGMPILNVDKCKEIFIFNYDTKPGYAGVDNPIYTRKEGVHLYLGNAADTLQSVIEKI